MTPTFQSYLDEKKKIKRLNAIRLYFYFLLLAVFFYFLFSVSYMASPVIVLFNYLAVCTSIFGILQYKMYEIPRLLLEVQTKGKEANFFLLSETERLQILSALSDSLNLERKDMALLAHEPEEIIQHFQLHLRKPWYKIGLYGFYLYAFAISSGIFYLVYEYCQTGFDRY